MTKHDLGFFFAELIEQNLGGLEDSNVRENVSLRNLEELVESDGLKSSSKVDSSLIFRILENYNEKIKVDPQSEDVISRSIQQVFVFWKTIVTFLLG